jgi:hypothetical protein
MAQIKTGNPKIDQAWRYALRIRNFDKREYAIQYLEYLRGHRDEPTEPRELSCMGAQAVRMNLFGIFHPLERAD